MNGNTSKARLVLGTIGLVIIFACIAIWGAAINNFTNLDGTQIFEPGTFWLGIGIAIVGGLFFIKFIRKLPPQFVVIVSSAIEFVSGLFLFMSFY